MFTGAAALFPVMLYSTLAPENSLTPTPSLPTECFADCFNLVAAGFVLATAYFIFISRANRKSSSSGGTIKVITEQTTKSALPVPISP